jgi:tRNA-specific 2-thiouridylase
MGAEAIEHYLRDGSRRGPAPDGAFTGSAGGAPCGDLVRLSLSIRDCAVAGVSFDAEGCAASRAAAAAVAEMADGAWLLEAASLSADAVSEELGGLAPSHRHAADLAADALHRALAAAARAGLRGSALLPAPEDGGRVLVALSGGVDSAVAALLERERGAEVVAVTLKLWADQETDGEASCCSPQAVLTARRVAHSLGIPHLTLDLEPEFRAGVVQPFIDGYRAGTTPNPCVLCNGEVRLDAMITLADRLGASSLVTGHYARVVDDGEGPLLAPASDPAKDQTYMLAGLRPESLARMRFPLAGLSKPEVRALASDAGLEVAGRAESQDLCFLAGTGKREFLRRHAGLGERRGDVLDTEGNLLGSHDGHHGFTVGQRRGIGVAAPEPLYVLATEAEGNTVTVGGRDQLRAATVRLRGARLHRDPSRVDSVRLRYHSPLRGCRVESFDADGGATLELDEPADAAAPGQVACLMDGEMIVGHGTIAG